MKRLMLLVVTLALLAVPASAQFVGRTLTVTQLPLCQNPAQFAVVTDATNATTLGAGGGSATVWVTCASGSWAVAEVAAVADLSGYVQDSEAAQVSIEASGAGNDVTLLAADDVILTPTDDLTVNPTGLVNITPGESFAVTTTAGAVTLTAGGTTQDVTLVSVDDVLVTPADDFVVTPTAGSAIINAVGAGEDVSLVAADDVLLTPTDALTAAVGGAASVTTTAGAITLTAGGTTEDISLISVDQVIIDGAGGDDELVVDDDSVAVGAAAAFYVAIASAPPVACAAGTKGALYYDSDINKMCICNATNYVLVNDDSTTTGCS